MTALSHVQPTTKCRGWSHNTTTTTHLRVMEPSTEPYQVHHPIYEERIGLFAKTNVKHSMQWRRYIDTTHYPAYGRGSVTSCRTVYRTPLSREEIRIAQSLRPLKEAM